MKTEGSIFCFSLRFCGSIYKYYIKKVFCDVRAFKKETFYESNYRVIIITIIIYRKSNYKIVIIIFSINRSIVVPAQIGVGAA